MPAARRPTSRRWLKTQMKREVHLRRIEKVFTCSAACATLCVAAVANFCALGWRSGCTAIVSIRFVFSTSSANMRAASFSYPKRRKSSLQSSTASSLAAGVSALKLASVITVDFGGPKEMRACSPGFAVGTGGKCIKTASAPISSSLIVDAFASNTETWKRGGVSIEKKSSFHLDRAT
jgi:hypothetical protein